MFTITHLAQLDAVNKYASIVPQELIGYLKLAYEDDNEPEFIHELHDGWRIVFVDSFEQLPSIVDFTPEVIVKLAISSALWISVLYIEDNETSCQYIYKYDLNSQDPFLPQYEESCDL